MKFRFEQIPVIGIGILIFSALPSFFLFTDTSSLPSARIFPSATLPPANKFVVPLSPSFDALIFGLGASQISFSSDPPRPNQPVSDSRIIVLLMGAKQSKRLELPAKLGLQFDGAENLQFSDTQDSFWLECALTSSKEVEASLYYKTPEGAVVCKQKWTSKPQETPFDVFPIDGPLKKLAEMKWWGSDLFGDKYGETTNIQRVEIESAEIDFVPGDWLVYKNNKWQKGDIDDSSPIAHIVQITPYHLELEGWDQSGHIRFKLPMLQSSPGKSKGEDLFSQLRIRSEKQISCVMDKQCLILRTGDFVIKIKDRWKVLRKKEEKDALLSGKIAGDCFVLERIDSKGKNITGTLFSAKRTASIPIEYSQPLKKPQPMRGK